MLRPGRDRLQVKYLILVSASRFCGHQAARIVKIPVVLKKEGNSGLIERIRRIVFEDSFLLSWTDLLGPKELANQPHLSTWDFRNVLIIYMILQLGTFIWCKTRQKQLNMKHDLARTSEETLGLS